jgi:hypothetical protein
VRERGLKETGTLLPKTKENAMARTFLLVLIVALCGLMVVTAVAATKTATPAAPAAPAASATAPAGGSSTMPAGYTGKPFGGKVHQIPGTIQVEDHDVAADNKEDVTFHYKGGAKKSDYRADSIGIAKFGGGHVNTKGVPEKADQVYLGWTQDGEWMKYTVHVAEAGTYRFGGKLSAAGKDGKLSVTFTPTLKIGPVAIPTTDGFQPGVEVYHVWLISENMGEVTLPAGDYVMQVTLEKNGGCNMDYFTFTKK